MRRLNPNEIVLLLAAPAVLILIGSFWPESIVTRLTAVFLFLFYAHKLGTWLIEEASDVKRWVSGAFALLAVTVLFQTAFYYLGILLSAVTDAVSLALAIWLLFTLLFFTGSENEELEAEYTLDYKKLAWFAAFFIPAVICIGFVLKAATANGTTESIRTPWPFLPEGSFLAIALLPIFAWFVAKKTTSTFLTGIVSLMSVLSVTLIAPFIYKLGFGFDGFLHRASQRILFETGTLTPKPLYYIGQYTLNTWMSRLIDINLIHIDRFLVPLSISLLIAALYLVFRRTQSHAFAISAAAAVITLSPFVATTPQAFAYIVGTCALILSFGVARGIHVILPLSLAFWCLAIHPLAGLPFIGAVAAVIWAGWLTSRDRTPLRSPIIYLLVFGTAISVPLAFFVFSQDSGQIAWNVGRLWNNLPAFGELLLRLPQNHVALWADWANYAAFLLPFIAWGFSIYALKDTEERTRILPLLLISAGTWISGYILSTVGEFTFLINYERGNYSDRLTLISFMLLFYPSAVGFGRLSKHMLRRGPLAVAVFLLCFAAWQAGHAYNALPRHDAAAASRGWSVGRHDFEAVRFIEQDAGETSYTVLANQSVSAAAVETYGFARYVENEKTAEQIFYYPIPTGGTLYQLYLNAVSPEPSFDAINEAGRLGESEIVYVVLNDYWWDAERVGGALQEKAEDVTMFGDGQVRVFRFSVHK